MDESLLRTISEVEHDHWWFVVRRRIVTDALERLPLPADADVVEVGCGSGGTLAHLAKRHPRWKVTGVEPSRAAADVARSRGCTVLEGALPHLDLEDECADCVIALDVLEHCADDVAAAREMARVLRPGAHAVVTVPALPSLWSLHDIDNAHFRRYTSATLERALDAGGLSVQRLSYFNTLLLPLGYATRLASRMTGSRRPLGVSTPPPVVNAALRRIFGIEAALLRGRDLPIGMSLLAIARKDAAR